MFGHFTTLCVKGLREYLSEQIKQFFQKKNEGKQFGLVQECEIIFFFF